MTTHARYPAYKESGVEWLGEIPADWEVKRLKFAALIRGTKMQAMPEDAIYVGLENVEPWTGRLILDVQPESVESAVSAFRKGDVLFGKLRPYLAKAASPDFDGVCTSEIVSLSPNQGISQKFIMYCLLSGPFIRWVDSMTFGSKMPRLSPDQIRSSRVPVPCEAEQRAIAAFLDRETARIDMLVAKNERLIDLLQEQRTAIITRAVTNGLDSNVVLKESGVESLGRIPPHWRPMRLKFALTEPLKYGANEASDLDDRDLPRYVRITDIDDTDGLRDETFKSLPVDVAHDYLLHDGDLLLARSGATAGKTFLYRKSWGVCAYAGYLIRARLDIRVLSPAFARYFTASSSYWRWVSTVLIQATIPNVSADKYASLILPIPAVAEQNAIIAFLDHETKLVDRLLRQIRDAIERLKELRGAIIAAAVTGKIDVRRGSE